MRVTVIGAGAVGGVLAALLDRAGHEVSVLARGEHGAAIAANGLRLDGGFGTHVAPVRVDATAAPDTELVIIAVKANDTAAALAGQSVPPGCPMLVVQNGLGGEAVARALLPESPAAVGLVLFAASLIAPGRITVTGAAPMVVGGDAAAVTAALTALGSALPEPVTRSPDILGAQWTKLVINQVNALPAITGMSVQQTVSDDALRGVLAAGMAETARVGEALGIGWQAIGPVTAGVIRPLARPGGEGLRAGDELARMLARGMGEVPNPASMLQSIRRGRLTEVDEINGAVVDHGERARVATPVNTALVTLVHEVEQTRAHLTVADTLTRLAPALASTTQD